MTAVADESFSIELNGEPHLLPRRITVAELLAEVGIAERPVAVELNGQVVPKAEHEQRRLAPGDRVEIVTFVGGG